MLDLYKYENELLKTINVIGGVDEAGRGPIYGPVVAACVVLNKNFKFLGINDSKKLSEKKRQECYKYIINNSIWAVGIVESFEIDKINIYEATKVAMKKAISKVNKKVKLEHILIDYMKLDLNIPSTSIVKGDSKSISIAAASIVAKVTRDNLMKEIALKHPKYGFDKHKGYPTKGHLENLKKHSLIKGYRKSFNPVKEIIYENKKNNSR